jgi:hypothetical protein
MASPFDVTIVVIISAAPPRIPKANATGIGFLTLST